MILQELVFIANFFNGKIIKFNASDNSAIIEYSDGNVCYKYMSGLWKRVD